MAVVVSLPQTSNWAKREHRPPIKPHKDPLVRDYVTKDEVEAMVRSARKTGGRTAERDALLIMLAYRHGLRASELTGLRWDQVDLKAGLVHVARLKRGDASTHPLRGPELRALRVWKRRQDQDAPYIFTSLRGGPMTRRTVHYVVAQMAKSAGIPFPVHPHMLRHGTGFYLANQGHDTRAIQLYLGHKNIQHTVRYTQLAAGRFKDFWKD
jgi:type 1 fimbriae regulatory protein FimB/type 1 fimbriae regulatory protein FimE